MSYLFNTWLNFREEERQEEINTLPSETQPDEVLTVREMLERHVRGLPISGNEQGVYLPEEVGYIPDYRTLDLTEIDEYRQKYAETIQRYNNPEPAPAGGTPNTGEAGTEHSTTDPELTPDPSKQPQA
jgi:hypothetical protein